MIEVRERMAHGERADLADFLSRMDSLRPKWMKAALCREYPNDWFYPDDGNGVARAIGICNRCPVRQQCLDYALEHNEMQGVWGGESQRERARMRPAWARRRKAAAAQARKVVAR